MCIVYKRRRISEMMQKNNYHEEERCGGFQLSLDLIVEILKKLPAKSLVRFRCVSKQWSAIIGSRRDFINSIVTRSLAQQQQQLPLFIFHHCKPETFFTVSSSFSENIKPAISISGPHESFSLEFQYYMFKFQYARGLICCSSPRSRVVTIYNPTTRQSVRLPGLPGLPERLILTESQTSYCHFGYDPVMDQYKVMYMIIDFEELTQTFHVFTLGQSQSWRRIQSDIDEKLFPSVIGLCIDGTIYYGATRIMKRDNYDETLHRESYNSGETVLLSFDIRSEKFSHVWAPEKMLKPLANAVLDYHTLLNHQGKLGCICFTSNDTSLWIMDNAEKQEWSKITFALPQFPLNRLQGSFRGFSGVTSVGEIFVTQYRYFFDRPLYVYYYDVKQNSFKRVEIPGTRYEKIRKDRYRVQVFAIHDHVENTMWL